MLKIPFVSGIEIIRSILSSFSAHVSGVAAVVRVTVEAVSRPPGMAPPQSTGSRMGSMAPDT